jgi:hypothetical protein
MQTLQTFRQRNETLASSTKFQGIEVLIYGLSSVIKLNVTHIITHFSFDIINIITNTCLSARTISKYA